MSSNIITCFILAISFFECSKAGRMDCNFGELCSPHLNTAQEILCPTTRIRKNEAYLILTNATKNGNSMKATLHFNLDNQTKNDRNERITIDICEPNESTLAKSNLFILKAEVTTSHGYYARQCDLHPVNETIREGLRFLRARFDNRTEYCDDVESERIP